ncbi:MAG: hypothetical protein HY906_10925 [Deltaproteobacteria bacterium]|nr:hypothetical protein [Deltaproteobacteria bacterium]
MHEARLGLFLVAVASILTASACWSANPLYCDQATPCTDPTLPRCELVAHQCFPEGDGGAADAAGDQTVPPPDGGAPADSGCAPGSHSCSGTCYPDTDPAHCGAGCAVCGGKTPECAGGTCVCTSTSCAGNEVCSGPHVRVIWLRGLAVRAVAF